MYSNYASFIKRAEIRIFEQQQSLEAAPLKIITVDDAGLAEWHPTQEISRWPVTRPQVPATRLRLELAISTKRMRGRCGVPRAIAWKRGDSRRAVEPASCWPPTAKTIWRASRFRSAAAR